MKENTVPHQTHLPLFQEHFQTYVVFFLGCIFFVWSISKQRFGNNHFQTSIKFPCFSSSYPSQSWNNNAIYSTLENVVQTTYFQKTANVDNRNLPTFIRQLICRDALMDPQKEHTPTHTNSYYVITCHIQNAQLLFN